MVVAFIYKIIFWVSDMHNRIIDITDYRGFPLTDKQLHFLVIGSLGMLLIFVVYPIFKLLARHNHTLIIAWIYVFTLLMGIAFAIEIGQRMLGLGTMEMADIYYGIFGFLFLFLIFLVIRGIYHLIVKAFKKYTRYKGRH